MSTAVALKAPTVADKRDAYFAQYNTLIDACVNELSSKLLDKIPAEVPSAKRDKQNLVGAVSRDLGHITSAVEQQVLAKVREKVGLKW